MEKNNQVKNICNHNNTFTSGCSDCDEQEYLDAEIIDEITKYALSEITAMLVGGSNNILSDIIDDYQKYGEMQSDDLKIRVEQEVLKILNKD